MRHLRAKIMQLPLVHLHLPVQPYKSKFPPLKNLFMRTLLAIILLMTTAASYAQEIKVMTYKRKSMA
jgi:hypothetical protein